MSPELKAFVDKVLKPPAPVGNSLYGGPGGFGASAFDVVQDLRVSTNQFVKEYEAKANQETLETLAQKIEGDLLTLNVLGKSTRRFTDELITELHALIDTA